MLKGIFFSGLIATIAISCNNDDNNINTQYQDNVDLTTQNEYDDLAAIDFLETHYFDDRGNVTGLEDNDTIHKALSKLEYVTLPSGVIYLVRDGAQPENGTDINSTSVIRLMTRTYTYIATKSDGEVTFSSVYPFRNTIDGTGNPDLDPSYYYVKNSVLESADGDATDEIDTTNDAETRAYYEIEGLKEALPYFKAFDIPDSDDYNLQGIIIVPSRMAFARDDHYAYNSFIYRNRSFIFNFQVYKAHDRTSDEE